MVYCIYALHSQYTVLKCRTPWSSLKSAPRLELSVG